MRKVWIDEKESINKFIGEAKDTVRKIKNGEPYAYVTPEGYRIKVSDLDDAPKNGAVYHKSISESGIKSIDSTAITHSSVGDFTYDTKTGAVSKMKGGGHGQANIDFLEAKGMQYNIVHVYDNGVRIGNVPDHKVKAKRTGINQSWFPANWSETFEDISQRLQSQTFIECLQKLDEKFPELEMTQDIDLAETYI
ncbi:MAG: EndoU domain-containing protein [Lachnospiraceae bacterium]|nr:EndoU domain-containing protein [Lachnospiraceae bacterium]